jgi:TolB-like protein
MKITFKTPTVSLAIGITFLGAMFTLPAIAETKKTSAVVETIKTTAAPAYVAPNQAFNDKMLSLALQLEKNLDVNKRFSVYAVTTFVDLDKFASSNSVSRLMTEQLVHELQLKQWNIIDLRLSKTIAISDGGEFSLSRDARKLRSPQEVSGVVSGTFSVVGEDIFINVRVLDYTTGAILSSAQTHFDISSVAGHMLDRRTNLTRVNIVPN